MVVDLEKSNNGTRFSYEEIEVKKEMMKPGQADIIEMKDLKSIEQEGGNKSAVHPSTPND